MSLSQRVERQAWRLCGHVLVRQCKTAVSHRPATSRMFWSAGRSFSSAHRAAAAIGDTCTGRTFLEAGPLHPARLDRFLAERRPGVPFSFVQKLIRLRKVSVQNSSGVWQRVRDPARRLDAGERVCVHSRLFTQDRAPDQCRANTPAPADRDVQRVRDAVLFEDDLCLVLNKPSGLAVQGGSKIPEGRHLDAWMAHVAGRNMRLVHRLDRETSGCLVMAKTRVAAAALADAFKHGRATKMYVALVAGHLSRPSGTIDAALMKISAPGGQDRVCCVPAGQGGLAASTRFRVLLKATTPLDDHPVHLVALWPSQGRTHQLRVHCSERLGVQGGASGARQSYIVGDAKYGPKSQCLPAPRNGRGQGTKKARLCLHALRLTVEWAAPTDGPADEAQLKTKGVRHLDCVAGLPAHMIATAEVLGLSRGDLQAALGPFI